LGFIANKDFSFSMAERAVNNADVKCEHFHRQLGKFLAIIATALTLEDWQFFAAVLPGGFLGWRRMVCIFQQIFVIGHG
jgi:hypothetical protein